MRKNYTKEDMLILKYRMKYAYIQVLKKIKKSSIISISVDRKRRILL